MGGRESEKERERMSKDLNECVKATELIFVVEIKQKGR